MSQSPVTVLFVDDHEDTAQAFATWFRMRGAIAVPCRSAGEAWEILQAIAVDAVVTDLAMPEENGLALATRIRADARLRSIALVAVSGYYRAAERPEVMAAGFDSFHTKPVPMRRIELEIGALLGRLAG